MCDVVVIIAELDPDYEPIATGPRTLTVVSDNHLVIEAEETNRCVAIVADPAVGISAVQVAVISAR